MYYDVMQNLILISISALKETGQLISRIGRYCLSQQTKMSGSNIFLPSPPSVSWWAHKENPSLYIIRSEIWGSIMQKSIATISTTHKRKCPVAHRDVDCFQSTKSLIRSKIDFKSKIRRFSQRRRKSVSFTVKLEDLNLCKTENDDIIPQWRGPFLYCSYIF